MTALPDTTASARKPLRRLGWLEASLWMGATFPAWWRILRRGAGSVPLSRLPAAACDGTFALFNSKLRAVQQLGLSRSIARQALPPAPLFIVGHWRTGTTLMHELLALDSRWRTPSSFECFVPAHFATSRYWLAPWSEFVLPRIRPPDQMAMGWQRPQEDEFALCLRGAGSLYDQIAFPQRITAACPFLSLTDLTDAERTRWERTWTSFLRELQWVRPGRILLKSPTHSYRIDAIVRQFPDARFLFMVRHPYDVFASACKLWDSLFALHGYQRWPMRTPEGERRLREFVLELMERLIVRIEPVLQQHDSERLRVIRFEEFVAAPEQTLAAIYDWLDVEVPPALKSKWRQETATRSAHRAATYQLDDEQQAVVNERWSNYFDWFAYPQR